MSDPKIGNALALIMRIQEAKQLQKGQDRLLEQTMEAVLFGLGWTKVAPDPRVMDGRDDLWLRPGSSSPRSWKGIVEIAVTREEAITEVIEVHGDLGRVVMERREKAKASAGGNGHGRLH